MNKEGGERMTIYKIVVNQEEQHSIWQADRENALDWRNTSKTGTKEECRAYAEEISDRHAPIKHQQEDGRGDFFYRRCQLKLELLG